jgi:filamentous hemagglutinin family protein
MCRLIALALFGGGVAHAATTPPPFSAAWLAARQPGATPSSSDAVPRADGRPASLTPGNALQQQRVQQSIQNLNTAAAALATQMQQQATAAATAPRVSGVPDGLAEGGLKPAAGLAADPTLWQNARQPTDTVAANARHTVEVKQTAKKAILTWDSFNVGRDTTLYVNQSAGNLTSGGNDWVALNRITDPTAKPSTILGQIRAEGTVYLLNRNGMIFGSGSQVNVHSLIASSLDLYSPDRATSNARFLAEGFASTASGGPQMSVLQSAFAPGAGHDVTIAKGAGITTGAQGFAIVAAPNVVNEGAVVADDGQAILAAGTVFDASLAGTSGRILLSETSSGAYTEGRGTVSNRGLVQARRGEIDLTGYGVAQDGVVMASTSIAAPGTITITGQSGRGSRSGPVTFGAQSVTTILPEKDGATTSSTAAADKVFTPGKVTVTGGNVSLASGALIEAPGSTVALTAIRDSSLTAEGVVANAGRVYVNANATIDVSGLADVDLPMSALLVNVPRIGQNELADSPLLRNGFLYTQKNVLIDSSQSGTRADGLDWIGSPILNVKGYVENVPRDISQMLTRAGSITLDGNEVITRSGSSLRLDGGYLAYQAGWITTPNLLGADGRIYDISSADPDVEYIGFAGQYTATHARWGVSQTYNSPLLGGSRRWAEGFVSGSDAGDLAVHARSGLALDGEMTAQATVGARQAANGTPPDGGTFVFDTTPVSTAPRQVIPGVRLQQSSQTLESLMPGFDGGDDLADVQAPSDDGQTWLVLSADTLGKGGFSALTIDNRDGAIEETEGTRVTVSPGGSLSMAAGRIDIHGSLVAPSGTITLTTQTLAQFADHANPAPDITLTDGALLSTRGLWVNDTNRAGTDVAGSQFINGGNITLATRQSYQGDVEAQVDQTGSIRLARGSTIDVSSGGYVGVDGRVATANGVPLGRGGNVSLLLYDVPATLAFGDQKPPTALDSGYLVMDGAIDAYGFAGGGTLALHAAQVQVGGDPAAMTQPNGLYLTPSFFQGQGFDNYVLHAVTDATVAPGTQVQVRRANRVADLDALRFLGSGTDIDASNGASVIGYLDPYQRWATRGTETGQGPGFSLVAGDYLGWPSRGSAGGQSAAPVYAGVSGSADIGAGAQVVVDAGGTIALASPGAVVVDGVLRAPGGNISLTNSKAGNTVQVQPSRVWLGATGVLDASGVSLIDTQATPATLVDTGAGTGTPVRATPRTGTVLDGGRVTLDSPYTGYVVAANGSVIDVSGASDTYDLPTGTRRLNGTTVDDAPTAVWSDAGNITIGAVSGLYLGAALRAHAGDTRGEGGSLAIVPRDEVGGDAWAPVTMLVRARVEDAPGYASSVTDTGASAQGVLAFGVDRLQGSGIASLSLGADPAGGVANTIVPVTFAGDVDLDLARSFSAYALAYRAVGNDATGTEPVNGFRSGNGQVHLRAPYVHLAGGAPSVTAAEAGDGTLLVQANAIDLGGALNLQGWGGASFNATGDLRFAQDALLAYDTAGARVPGMLFSTGDLTFRAAQVYPVTDYRFVIDANASGIADAQGNARETTVTFLPGGASSAPLSAGGALLVSADRIEQQGTLRAPAGSLILGVSDPQAAASRFGLGAGYAPLVATTSVHLAPGSITSVSLGGATVPYGSTVDGVDWRYNGAANVSSAALTAPPSKQVELHGTALALDSGASIDLAGGGQLQAAEFVAGVGGTRDVLASSGTGTGAAVYAILPGFNGPVAAQDSAFSRTGGTQPRVGESVYLSGMPGLPAGMYTLLPAQYAQLSGAYRIVQDTTAQDSVLGRSSRMADGTYAVSGYFGDALSGGRGGRPPPPPPASSCSRRRCGSSIRSIASPMPIPSSPAWRARRARWPRSVRWTPAA